MSVRKVNPSYPILVNKFSAPGPHRIHETSRRKSKPDYEANCKSRRDQKSPAAQSRAVHKGPSHRPAGLSPKDWTDMMDGQAKR